MTKPKFTLIQGARDQIEQHLVEALFSPDETEIARLIDLLNKIGNKQPQLTLVNPTQSLLSN